MATTSSPKITSDARESKSNHSSSKRLWQVPVFLVGVAALFAVWHYRPLWTDHPARQIERDLSAVRRLLANPESDVEEEVRIAERAVETSEQVEDRAGEAYFLLGSAQIMLAERAAPCDAWQHWGPALMNLEQADKKGVP